MSAGRDVARRSICVVARISRHLRREGSEGSRRLLGQALNRMARASQAGAFVWWRGVVREAQATDTARGRCPTLRAGLVGKGNGYKGRRLVAPRPATARRHRAATRLFGQALCRLARSSEGLRLSIGAALSSRRLRRRRVKGEVLRPWNVSCEGSRACQ